MAYAEFWIPLHLQLLIIFMYIVDLAAVAYHSLLGFAVAFFIRCADDLLIKQKSTLISLKALCVSFTNSFSVQVLQNSMYPD